MRTNPFPSLSAACRRAIPQLNAGRGRLLTECLLLIACGVSLSAGQAQNLNPAEPPALPLAGAQNPAGSPTASADFRTDRILVKPKTGIAADALTRLHGQLGARVRHSFPRLAHWQVVDLPPLADVTAMIAAYQQSGLVERAEPDYALNAQLTPNDFHFYNGDQWNLNNVGQYGGTPGADIHAPAGWNYQNTASNIIVAVIDTGVRYTHEDLAANLWTCPGGTNHGINTITGTDDPWDDYGHGTHLSGIIGAVGNNGIGIAGLCWSAQLMECKFINALGQGTVSDAITCLDYALTNGARIINASWGGYSFTSAALQDTINALRDAGIIVVAAAGNNNNNNDANPLFPASYPYDNVISVAATDRNDNKATFSNYGASSVLLAAPGDPVFSCWNTADNAYQYCSGTSQSVPQVVGACALIWSLYPTLSHQQVIRRVLEGVNPLPSLAGLCTTGGRLDLANALAPQPPPTVSALTVWCDDALPAGAVPESGSGDTWTGEPWNWVTNNPAPFSGTTAHQSALLSGIHMHYFDYAASTLEIFSGDTLFTYVYLDPVHPPQEIMLSWKDRCWEHRAYWGANLIPWGADGSSDRRYQGPLPPAGQWVRLAVPAHQLMLEGAKLTGMGFILYDGLATWDYSGRSNP